MTRDFPAGAPGHVEWSETLPTIECPLGQCRLVEPRIAPSPDGSLWVVADVIVPGSGTDDIDVRVLGSAILRYDASGQRVLEQLTDYRTRLAGVLPSVTGLSADVRGHLLWVAPMSSEPGVELREYDPSGELVRRQALVRGVTRASGAATPDGTVALTYEYDPPFAGVPDSGSVLDDVPGNAFDAAGLNTADGVLWNLPLSQVFGFRTNDRLPQTLPTRNGMLFRAYAGPTLNPDYMVIAQLSSSGVVQWVRRTPADNCQIVAFDDGGFLFQNAVSNPENSLTITRFDSDGRAAFRLNTHLLFAVPINEGNNAGFQTAFAGRAFGSVSSFAIPGQPGLTEFFSLSEDGATSWRSPPLEVLACAQGGSSCPQMSVTEGGRIFVAGTDVVGSPST